MHTKGLEDTNSLLKDHRTTEVDELKAMIVQDVRKGRATSVSSRSVSVVEVACISGHVELWER